jgi:hypothetical protein
MKTHFLTFCDKCETGADAGNGTEAAETVGDARELGNDEANAAVTWDR